MTAVSYQGPVALHGGPLQRPQLGSVLTKFVVALLIVAGALTTASPSVPRAGLSNSGTAAPVAVASAAGSSELELVPVRHRAAARERAQSARQFTRCVHLAHRNSADPAACRVEHS